MLEVQVAAEEWSLRYEQAVEQIAVLRSCLEDEITEKTSINEQLEMAVISFDFSFSLLLGREIGGTRTRTRKGKRTITRARAGSKAIRKVFVNLFAFAVLLVAESTRQGAERVAVRPVDGHAGQRSPPRGRRC